MVDLELPLGQLRIPHFPVPEGETVESWLRAECERGLARRYGTVTAGAPGAPGLRARDDHLDGVRGLLPHRGRLRPLRPRAGDPDDLPGERPGLHRHLHPGHHPGRPDPLPAALRAVPQPRPRDDAGHRRRLRGRPARRGHQLRQPQVRRRPRRPDHHLRHDARPGGDPRRGPRPGAAPTATSTGSPRRSRTSSASGSTRRSRSAPRLKEMHDGDPAVHRIIDFAKQLEGVARNASTHAAGVVISREPLTELMPLQKATNSDATMTQYEMHGDRGPGAPQVRLPGPLQPDDPARCRGPHPRAARHRDRPGADPARRREDLRAPGLGRDDRHLPAGVGRDAALHPRAPPRPRSTTWPPWSPCTAPGPWRTSRPTSGASTARRRSPTSTRSWSRSWSGPTGSSSTRRTSWPPRSPSAASAAPRRTRWATRSARRSRASCAR